MRLLLSLSLSLAVAALILTAIAGSGERRAGGKLSAPETDNGTVTKATVHDPVSPPPSKGYIYRWRDANGTIHIQSTPPPPDRQAEKIAYDKAQPPPAAEQKQARAETDDRPSVRDRVSNPLSVYTPEGFEKLLETVEETATRLKQRDQVLDKLSKDL